eukprot:6209649-Pleurochrysis_carterae.AAC.1
MKRIASGLSAPACACSARIACASSRLSRGRSASSRLFAAVARASPSAASARAVGAALLGVLSREDECDIVSSKCAASGGCASLSRSVSICSRGSVHARRSRPSNGASASHAAPLSVGRTTSGTAQPACPSSAPALHARISRSIGCSARACAAPSTSMKTTGAPSGRLPPRADQCSRSPA